MCVLFSTHASAASACAAFLCLFNLECFVFLPRAHPVFQNVEKGGTHRWGLSKARNVWYNPHKHTHTHTHSSAHSTVSCQCRSTFTRMHKSMYGDITSKQMSVCVCVYVCVFVKARHTHTHTHTNTRAALWVHEESAAWRGQCIHTEGQAEKDRWWCTSDFNSQGTPRCSPGCSTLSRKTNWPKTTEAAKWKSLASWKGIKRQFKMKRN